MSGIEMWEQFGMGFWDIVGAMWLDVLAGLCAFGWTGFLFFLGVGSLNKEDLQVMGWKWMLKQTTLLLTLLLPMIRLTWLVVTIWFVK